MKHVKTYENFQMGNEIILMMTSDRKYFVSVINKGSLSGEITLVSSDKIDFDTRSLREKPKLFKSIEEASSKLEPFINPDPIPNDVIPGFYEGNFTNYNVRINPWVKGNYVNHDIYSLHSREEIIEYIESGAMDDPNYPEGDQKSTNAVHWSNYSFPCYSMDWENQHVQTQNAKGNIIKDERTYMEFVNSLEPVKIFLGAYEKDDSEENDFLNL